ncbi:MAG: MerR family transcriptional regulator [Lachnospiraceae bacterium]|nr:MerR family transcriptional regulator [Lachnospiraceae bacterium]
MDNKMTSGEIAKKAGVSQKAVRLYDEKGLLKPSDYSEGNYRLYDNEALLVLEKIIALKQIGFSLEEIKENLVGSGSKSILETLQEQIDMMEAKRYELEKAVKRIKAVIARSNGEPDWDDVADILKNMQVDQNKDAGHFYALDHSKGELDWFIKIYRDLKLKEGERVLDLGCGYSKVWRNSWEEIPENVCIDAYDLRGSWADDFEKFVEENKSKLSAGTSVNLCFSDIEDEATWKQIKSEDKYSMILLHYVADVLKNPEAVMKNISSVLSDDGFASISTYGNVPRPHYNFWYDVFSELEINKAPLDKGLAVYEQAEKESKAVLDKYFSKVEEVKLPSPFSFDSIDDICKDLLTCIPNEEAFIASNRKKLNDYFAKKLENGDVLIPHDGGFWRVRK